MIFGDESTDFTAKSAHTRRYDIPERGKALKKIEICYKKYEEKVTNQNNYSGYDWNSVTVTNYSIIGLVFYDKQDKTIFGWTSNCDYGSTVLLAEDEKITRYVTFKFPANVGRKGLTSPRYDFVISKFK